MEKSERAMMPPEKPVDDLNSLLPLNLIKSDSIPPAPTPTPAAAAADFLLDFACNSWIAYVASPLVVISHFPNPFSDSQTKIGPIFRQVIELSHHGDDDHVDVTALAWSPETPSIGQLAVGWNHCIGLFSYYQGSFCWRQTAKLKQSMRVEAIKWTGSGDGIIAVGIEVVMWRKKETFWEIAWKFEPKVPQTLVSTTWSADGLSATAAWSKFSNGTSSPLNDASNCVLVCQGEEDAQYPQAELHHPASVRMIQWRPSNGHGNQATRPVLLTCCTDGAVRLWSEIDDGRIRKTGKDNTEKKEMRLSFCVVAVVEVDQTLKGFLGSDVFVSWAMEVEGAAVIGKEAACYYSNLHDQHDTVGRCEWLIGFGPKRTVTLWAVHCLDDSAPVRFPRVTLWKKQELVSFECEASQLLLDKVLIMRNRAFGPPLVCSLVHLLACKNISWTLLHSGTSTHLEGNSANDDAFTSYSEAILKVDGHTGKVSQIAIHPLSLEVKIAASLDTNGMLLFWSYPTFPSSHIGPSRSIPSWELYGKISVSQSLNYTCMSWVPVVLAKDQIFLMGHPGGVDCFLLQTSKIHCEKIPFHTLFSIPISIEGHGRGLSRIHSIPLQSNYQGNSVSSKFLLVALWMDRFHAVSWEITITCDLQESCHVKHQQTSDGEFAGKRFSYSIDPVSSMFPSPHDDDMVTSCAVVCPINLGQSIDKELTSADEKGSYGYAYHMITGCSNGNLKLWRSMPAQSLSSGMYWDLVGMLTYEQGPIMVVSPSACCRKIATASRATQPHCSTTVIIWECMQIHNAGAFMLEHQLYFDGEVLALNWLVVGNGHLLLAVCLCNEFRIYAPRRCGGYDILKNEDASQGNAWTCIAVNSNLPTMSDLLWGPKGTIMVVHDKYFSLFSHLLQLADVDSVVEHSSKFSKDSAFKESSETLRQHQAQFSNINIKDDDLKPQVNVESYRQHNLATKICFWSMSEVAEKIGGSLYLFHPEAFLSNLYSGNWRRAFIALKHLLRHLGSSTHSVAGYHGNMRRSMMSPIPLSNYLEGLELPSSSDKLFQWSSSLAETGFSHFVAIDGRDAQNTTSSPSSSRSEFADFIEVVERLHDYTYITKVEKMQTLALIDLLREISNPHSNSAYGSLDEPGRRFWVAVRFRQLFFARNFSRLPLMEELVVSSEMIGWAFHSDCHDNLFSSLLSLEPSWEEMRSLGVGLWYMNATQLRMKMERLARQQYMKKKDPKDCTLLYIALNRIQVLAGLFKISRDERDKPLAGFLARNFQEDTNKAAALKNAYVLMGKHQLELAIAFFLLGGDPSSAVTVCAKNLGDQQLALVLCRLMEGYGGPLEYTLISKFLLPSSLSKGDYWMTSLLEWMVGNYSKSYFIMLGFGIDSEIDIAVLSSMHASFKDPSVGRYCLLLSMKTSMKNAIGETNAAILSRWAVLISVTASSRCGLPLEALECFASSVSIYGDPTQGSLIHSSNCNLLLEMLKPSVKCSSNWISDNISCHIMSHSKLSLALQYITMLFREHPSYHDISEPFSRAPTDHKVDSEEFQESLEKFQGNYIAAIRYFQQKFSLIPVQLIRMSLLLLHHIGLEYIGRFIMTEYMPEFQPEDQHDEFDQSDLLKGTEEFSRLVVKHVAALCQNWSFLIYFPRNSFVGDNRFCWNAAWGFSCRGIAWSFQCIRSMFQLFFRSYSKDRTKFLQDILCLFEYLACFASSFLQRNARAFIVTLRPILGMVMNGDVVEIDDLHHILKETMEMLIGSSPSAELGMHVRTVGQQQEQNRGPLLSLPEEKRWPVISSSLWVHMSTFVDNQLDRLNMLQDRHSSPVMSMMQLDDNKQRLQIGLFCSTMLGFLKLTCADISYCCSKQFASHLLQDANLCIGSNLFYLEDALSQNDKVDSYQTVESVNLLDNVNTQFNFEQLYHICAHPKIIRGAFSEEYDYWLPFLKQRSSSRWVDAYIGITREFDPEETYDKEDKLGSPSHAGGSPLACLTPDDHPFKSSGDKNISDYNKVTPFHSPKEVYRRNGELLEAMCVNSVNECQAGLASNKKGIVFFNWEDDVLHGGKSEYIWEKVDWPRNGWAGSKSVPVPTCVSPGVGLGSKKGAHLGLGGATIGTGALVRPGRKLSGSGSFDLANLAGSGASSLGWGVQESFDEFVDPPATVDNVRTSAFASHPSRPFFLVGSSNTHIYLWEFCKDTATATYGVLPAANVPPPYALASVSALRFDHCGHHFVTGALDGTVCTWQLEVGGRNNVHPTESSVCFNNHTSDVTYVTASGSIVAAAGYSSTGVNVVVWDTLAPPSTSQASIMCHEGGAHSLSVFDNDIGSGSISPLILTGGKSGDVGLHDFRYIATGRIKRHKQSDTGEHNINASSLVDNMRSKSGDQNRNGMLWYIPKAHSGSVTKISTIPNTSFFLTGSKDGDVKLWDAKRAKLVFHWPRLHERHTFLQPSTRAFGGVVRAAVTDIQVVSHGFLTCGGDGSVKFVRFKNFPSVT